MQRRMICIRLPRKKGIGNRGVGIELGIVALLIIAVMSMLIVATTMGNVKAQRIKNDYTLKRTAIHYLAEHFVSTIERGGSTLDTEFYENNVSFTNVFPKTKAQIQQEITTADDVTTHTLYLIGTNEKQYLKVQVTKAKIGNEYTYTITEWVVSPNGKDKEI